MKNPHPEVKPTFGHMLLAAPLRVVKVGHIAL